MKQLRVLVVDDSLTIRRRFCEILSADPELDAIFIAAGAAIRPASTLDRMQNMDVAPTIAAILGIQMHAGIQGQVLLSILRN